MEVWRFLKKLNSYNRKYGLFIFIETRHGGDCVIVNIRYGEDAEEFKWNFMTMDEGEALAEIDNLCREFVKKYKYSIEEGMVFDG